MNKYQLAALAIAGRDFGKLMMNERALTLEWGDDDDDYYSSRNDRHSGDPITDDAGRLNYYRSMTPDSAIHSFGDSSKFTAFIYSSGTNTLFCQSGDRYHGEGLEDYSPQSGSELRQARKEPKGSRFLFGRFGKTPRGGGFITVWRTSDQVHDHESNHKERDPYDYDPNSYYNLKLGNVSVLKKMLAVMVQGSARIVGECPAEYPIKADYVYTDGDGVKEMVGKLAGIKGDEMPQGNSTCSQLAKLTINGREMPFGTALGNLHMVRGPQLDFIKNAICSDYDRLKDQLEKHRCDAQLSILGDMISRVSCPKSDREEWEKLKRQGVYNYRMDLQKVFSDPESIDREFRGRQSDIDAAWDYMRGNKREHYSYGYYVKMLMESQK